MARFSKSRRFAGMGSRVPRLEMRVRSPERAIAGLEDQYCHAVDWPKLGALQAGPLYWVRDGDGVLIEEGVVEQLFAAPRQLKTIDHEHGLHG